MNSENHLDNKKEENPFAEMGFFKFWIVSTLFWLTFPASIAVAYVTIGSVKTKQLFKALVHDFLQTLLIILIVISVIIYLGYQFIVGLFV